MKRKKAASSVVPEQQEENGKKEESTEEASSSRKKKRVEADPSGYVNILAILPGELVQTVARYCTFQELSTATLVCKSWRAQILSFSSWGTVYLVGLFTRHFF